MRWRGVPTQRPTSAASLDTSVPSSRAWMCGGPILLHHHDAQRPPGVRRAAASPSLSAVEHPRLGPFAALQLSLVQEPWVRLGFSAILNAPVHGEGFSRTTPIARPAIPDDRQIATKLLRKRRLHVLERLVGAAPDDDEHRHIAGKWAGRHATR
jgi:hypothetical protein